MNFKKIFFGILGLLFIILFTYNYFSNPGPKLENMDTENSCIALNEIDYYNYLKTDNYSINVPKEWKLAHIESLNKNNAVVFSINQNNPYEFLSVWISDYNKSSHDLIIDTLEPISKYEITEETQIKTEKNIDFWNIKITYKNPDNELIIQDMYAHTKNNVGYLILLRTNYYSYSRYLTDLEKILCSFEYK